MDPHPGPSERRKVIMRKFAIVLSLFLTLIPAAIPAVSPAVTSQEDYVYTLGLIRDLVIIVDNFGTDDQKKRFAEIRTKFQRASERHYAQDFITASSLSEDVPADNTRRTSNELFYDLKMDLIAFLKEMSGVYQSRTQEMLDLIATDATNVIVEYGRNSGLWKYFFRPIDPLVEKRPYDPRTYYYFHRRQKIEANLSDAYKSLQDSRELLENGDYRYIVDKPKKTKREINFIIDSYMGIIKYCRQAKKNGIEIYKVLNEKDLNDIIRKYDITMGAIGKYPIYDDRVPEKYKVDAVDVEKMLYRIEKTRVPNYDEINRTRRESASAATGTGGTTVTP